MGKSYSDHRVRVAARTVLLLGAFGAASCGEATEPSDEPAASIGQALESTCEVFVKPASGSIKQMEVEGDYLAQVVQCEIGGVTQEKEALEAAAIMARSYTKALVEYQQKGLSEAGAIAGTQADQDISCANNTPTAAVRAAVEATRGQVMTFNDKVVYGLYISGARTESANCVASRAEIDAADQMTRDLQACVTYNMGRTGNAVRAADCVVQGRELYNPLDAANRGAASQWGMVCLAQKQRNAINILRFFYGDDVEIKQLGGECGGQDVVDGGSPGGVDSGAAGDGAQSSGPGGAENPAANDLDQTCVEGGADALGQSMPGAERLVMRDVLERAVPRAAWGAAPSLKVRPRQGEPRRIIFHETDTPPGYNGEGAVRHLQKIHQENWGLHDIAFHYIVDTDGRIYEGTPIAHQAAIASLEEGAVAGDGAIHIALMGRLPDPADLLDPQYLTSMTERELRERGGVHFDEAQFFGNFFKKLGSFAEGVVNTVKKVTEVIETVKEVVDTVRGAVRTVRGIVSAIRGEGAPPFGPATTAPPSAAQLGSAAQIVGSAAGAPGSAGLPGNVSLGFIGKAVRVVRGIIGFLFGGGKDKGPGFLNDDGNCRELQCEPELKQYQRIKITASPTNTGGYPVDVVAITSGGSEIKALEAATFGAVTNEQGALGPAQAASCADFAVLAPGSSITLSFGGQSGESGSVASFDVSPVAATPQCMFAGSTARIEASSEPSGDDWDVVSAVTLPGISHKLPGTCEAN